MQESPRQDSLTTWPQDCRSQGHDGIMHYNPTASPLTLPLAATSVPMPFADSRGTPAMTPPWGVPVTVSSVIGKPAQVGQRKEGHNGIPSGRMH